MIKKAKIYRLEKLLAYYILNRNNPFIFSSGSLFLLLSSDNHPSQGIIFFLAFDSELFSYFEIFPKIEN